MTRRIELGRSASHLATALLLVSLLTPLPGGAEGAAAQEPEADDPEYAAGTSGTRWLESRAPGGVSIKVLLEAANLGGDEVAVAEITFPPQDRIPTRGHTHGSLEVFYVLSGVMEHVVNGESHVLEPGMVGVVRPGDEVIHGVRSSEPVRALVIWVPGTEVERIAPNFRQRPVEPGDGVPED